MSAPLEPLIVAAADVFAELGIRASPTAIPAVERAIRRVQAAVEAFLGQPIVPREVTETHLYPYFNGWVLKHDPIIGITSTTAELDVDSNPTGYFTVVYTYGLDAVSDPELSPIREYVIAHAAAQPSVVRLWAASSGVTSRAVKSASTEGQSVSYETLGPSGVTLTAAGVAAEMPTLASLSRWKRRGVFQRRGLAPGPFDYVGGYDAGRYW